MPRKARTATSELATDEEIDDDILSDEDYFLEKLRGAVARARSATIGRFDPHDGIWGRGLDHLQTDFGD